MTGQNLAVLLERHREEVAGAWAELVHQLPDSHYRERSLEELRASTMRGLNAIIHVLSGDSSAALETYLTDVSLSRLQMGFDIAEVIEALLLCKDAVLPVIWKAHHPNSRQARQAIAQLDACLRHTISRFGHLYAKAMHRSLEEQQQRIALMLTESQSLERVTVALLQKLELGEVLNIVCIEAQGLTGAMGSSVFLLDAERDGWLRVARSTGVAPPNFVQMPIQGSLTGMAARESKLFLSNNLASEAQGQRSGAEPTALLAVPLRVKGIVIGVLDMVNKLEGFTQEDVRISSLFADQAAIAIENARLYEQAQELAAVQERQRLARDLHDAVTQTLFSASLIAEVLPRLWERDADEGRRRLEELRQLTRGALAEMRTLLLELRPAALTEVGLGDLLHQLTEAVTGRARVPIALTVESQCPLPSDVQVALYRIAQEALNNIAKHSGATQVTVVLRCQFAAVELCVRDNGRGFDLVRVSPEHLGLRIMRERAESVGATFAIESRVGQGTQITVVWKDE